MEYRTNRYRPGYTDSLPTDMSRGFFYPAPLDEAGRETERDRERDRGRDREREERE